MGRADQGKSKPYGGNPPPNAALTLKGFLAHWQTIRHLLRAASADRPTVGTTNEPSLTPPNPLMIFCTRIWETDQIFAHAENKSADMESAMTFRRGVSGNPHGNRHHTRHLLNQRFLQALLLDFEAHGREAIEECRKQSPLGYVKVLGHLVPLETKIEHSQSLKSMSDQELDAAIEYVRGMLAARAGDEAKVIIEGTAETVVLPTPAGHEHPKRKPNRLMMEAGTAIGPRERKPRKVPSPPDG